MLAVGQEDLTYPQLGNDFYFYELCSRAEKESRVERTAFSEMCVWQGHNGKIKSNQKLDYKTEGRIRCYRLMQRGVETLDTYLKLLLQVLELRYIASLRFTTRKLWHSHQKHVYPKSSRESLFIFLSKHVSVPARLTRVRL